MEIRFPCPSCDQPIEVDREWASRAVACPYCRKTVTAPAESTLAPIDDIPVASPMGHPSEAAHPSPRRLHPAYSGANRTALVAMVLSMLMVLSLVAFLTVFRIHKNEMFDKVAMQGGFTESFDATQKGVEKIIEENGGVPPGWLLVLNVSELGGMLLWIAALICGIIGATRAPRRHLAVSALIAVAAAPVALCLGAAYIAFS